MLQVRFLSWIIDKLHRENICMHIVRKKTAFAVFFSGDIL